MTIFFIVGVTLFLFSQREIVGLIDLAEDTYLQFGGVGLMNEAIEKKYSFGHEIIAQKMSFKRFPIVVEGVTIETKDDLLVIDIEKKYLKNVILDEFGQFEYIEYKEN